MTFQNIRGTSTDIKDGVGSTVEEMRPHVKEFTPKRNCTSVNIVANVSHAQIQRLHINMMEGLIAKKNPGKKHCSVNIATSLSHVIQKLHIKGPIPKRNHTNATTARRVSLKKGTKSHMKGLIPKRNHTSVNIARRVSHAQIKKRPMKGFIPKINHTSVNIARRVSQRWGTKLNMKG